MEVSFTSMITAKVWRRTRGARAVYKQHTKVWRHAGVTASKKLQLHPVGVHSRQVH